MRLVPVDLPACDEEATLASLAARGLVDLPAADAVADFDGPMVSVGGSAAEMVIEDRR